MKNLPLLSLLILPFSVALSPVQGGPLTEARINRVQREVRITEQSGSAKDAQAGDTIRGTQGVKTGPQSAAELLFPDHTLARLGSDTLFTFDTGTRKMNLENGTLLFQIPKGVGGASIRTGAITAAITGTTGFIERGATHYKLVLLEGTMRVFLNDRLRESMLIHGGQMLIGPIKSDSLKSWQTVQIDIAKLMKTSRLLDSAKFEPLAEAARTKIDQVIQNQKTDLVKGSLRTTNLVIDGYGTTMLAIAEASEVIDAPSPTPTPATPTPTPATPTPTPATPTPTPATPTPTPATPTPTPATPTPTPATPTPTPATPTPTPATPTPTPATPTPTPATPTPTPATPTPTPATPTPTPATPTPTPATPTPTPATPTPTPATPTPTPATPTPTPATPTPTPATPTPTPATPTPTPATPTPTPATPTPTPATPTPTPATPTPTPATPTPTPTPLPTPTPTPTPVFTDARPPANGAIVIDNSVNIKTTTTPPTLSKGGTNYVGSLYQGATLDGPAADWVFGSSTTFDTQRQFDQRFGKENQGSFASAGVATYRFSSILLDGDPSFNLSGGPLDIALVADTTIGDSGGGPFDWKLNSLRSLTLIDSGGMNISDAKFMASGSTFKYLSFYDRSTSGTLAFGSVVSISAASVFFDAAANLSFTGDIDADEVDMNSGQTLTLNGKLQANLIKLTAGSSIQLQKDPNGTPIFYATAPAFTASADLTVAGGDLKIGGGGIDLNDKNVSGFDNIETTGAMYVGDVIVRNRFSVGGLLQSRTAQAHTITAPIIDLPLGLQFNGAGTAAGGTITLNADSLLFDTGSNAINGVNLDGGNGSLLGLAGGSGGTLNLGSSSTPIVDSVTINKPISATTGANPLIITTGGNGGTVNVFAGGTVTVNSSIKVSDSAVGTASRSAGKISIKSNKLTGTAIQINSTAQLNSLLSGLAPGPGGQITLTSAGGDVNVSGSVTSDRGSIDIRNNGAAGKVTLTNATMSADVVKVGALGANGQLTVGGGTLSADTTLKLYGGSSNGKVLFNDNVTLNGSSAKIISGNTVEISNGKVVTVNGPSAAQVYTNNPNYTGSGGNGATTGAFGGQGGVTKPLSQTPGF